eukprot:scaffold25487_cov232-Isochrysis_galbana.AAC.3
MQPLSAEMTCEACTALGWVEDSSRSDEPCMLDCTHRATSRAKEPPSTGELSPSEPVDVRDE